MLQPRHTAFVLLVVPLLLLPANHPPAAAPPDALGMSTAPVELRSAGALHFAPDGTLFVADPLGAQVFALDAPRPVANHASGGVDRRPGGQRAVFPDLSGKAPDLSRGSRTGGAFPG